MIDKRITDFIGRHHVLTLATGADGLLHCCSLFYAYLGESNLFVVTSGAQTLHAQQAAAHPRIAASIVLETAVIGKVQGLQIRGTMERPQDDELSLLRRAYLSRFPYAAVMELELWAIRPDYLKLTDNRLGFGKKMTWEKTDMP